MNPKKLLGIVIFSFVLIGCDSTPKSLPKLPIAWEKTDQDYDLMIRCATLHSTLAERLVSLGKSGDIFEDNFRAFANASMVVLLSNGYQGVKLNAERSKNKFRDDFENNLSEISSSITVSLGGDGVIPGQKNNQLLGQCGRLTNSKNYKIYYDHLISNKALWDELMN